MPSHLQACLQEARVDPAFITAALGDVARARGMVQLAREAGLTREGPYKALPKNGARHRPMDLRFHRRQLHCHRAGGLHPGLPAQADPQSEQQDRAREEGGRGLQARDPTHYASGLHGAMNGTAAASGPRTPVSALSASLADCPRTIRGAHVRHKDPLRQ